MASGRSNPTRRVREGDRNAAARLSRAGRDAGGRARPVRDRARRSGPREKVYLYLRNLTLSQKLDM